MPGEGHFLFFTAVINAMHSYMKTTFFKLFSMFDQFLLIVVASQSFVSYLKRHDFRKEAKKNEFLKSVTLRNSNNYHYLCVRSTFALNGNVRKWILSHILFFIFFMWYNGSGSHINIFWPLCKLCMNVISRHLPLDHWSFVSFC